MGKTKHLRETKPGPLQEEYIGCGNPPWIAGESEVKSLIRRGIEDRDWRQIEEAARLMGAEVSFVQMRASDAKKAA